MKTDKKILDACCGSRMMWFGLMTEVGEITDKNAV